MTSCCTVNGYQLKPKVQRNKNLPEIPLVISKGSQTTSDADRNRHLAGHLCDSTIHLLPSHFCSRMNSLFSFTRSNFHLLTTIGSYS